MTMRTSVVAVFTCDRPDHVASDAGQSSFAGASEAAAKLNAITAGWKPGVETFLGVPIQTWTCPRCARREAA